MVRIITPQIINSYAKALKVDNILKTKPFKIHIPKAEISFEECECKPTLLDLFNYFNLPKYYKRKNYLYIKNLKALEKGGGTIALKEAVKKSISMGNEGRVALHASMLDQGKGHPFLFYYKLGLRSTNNFLNKIAEKLLQKNKDGKRLNIQLLNSYFMYLPKENVEHCLNYKNPVPKLTYIPKINKSLKLNTNLSENYKKALDVQYILNTPRTSVKLPEPKIYVKTWEIYDFSPCSLYKNKMPKEFIHMPVTHIEDLESYEKGAGTRAIKDIVRKSLRDETEGRIILLASLISFKKGHPMGFYYKLGFRSVSEKYNKICEEWLKKGGKMEDRPWQIKYWPFAPQGMYLPKENIKHCLKYPEKTLTLAK